jgi:3-dehydroquinate synthase
VKARETVQTIKGVPLTVNVRDRPYDVLVHDGDLAGVGAFARQRSSGHLAIVITDENARPHAETALNGLRHAGFEAHLLTFPAGEQQKTLATAAQLYDRLADLGADRRTLIVAAGGGVVGDLAGFVAATYARGLPLLMVPTTLLAMVDSSLGGKVAVNHPRGKNLLGAFHQPVGVWIDTRTLDTLPAREYRSGLGEVVKYAVALDADLFAYLDARSRAVLDREPDVIRHVIVRCCQLKAGIVEQDEREVTGTRMLLNYGHTFAHAFETVSGYGSWLHGEAVAAGMMCAARLAERRGLVGPDVPMRQRSLLARFGLPLAPQAWADALLLDAMRRDKKSFNGRLRLVLPVGLGKVMIFDDVSEEEVITALRDVRLS